MLVSLTDDYPIQRAAAVKWSRVLGGGSGDIEVTEVRDFGIESLSQQAIDYFAEPQDNALPGVIDRNLWVNNRHVPLSPASLTPRTAQTVMNWMRAQDDHHGLYDGNMPTIVFNGGELTARLHNLPANAVPLQDFVLNLGEVLFSVAMQ